ncbi:hypothetical protein [Pleurocapsa sp. FMAR1]|uniref:hypothetical protein n=1 Tax=Pleurocapsa sp. FMAR1 TaxID=3040204 RepID=UPI0029C7592A|nr:hypothetical protein [Pleurocapsa sp. FMAR1]
MGEEADFRRDPGNRALDKYSRMLHKEVLKGKSKTPHVAMVELDGNIHAAGNSGKRRVTEDDSIEAQERILKITEPEATQDSQEHNDDERMKKDISKLSALREGTYHSDENESVNLRGIKEAIENNSIQWHQLDKREQKNGSKHGEMALHEEISEHAGRNKRPQNKKKEDIYVGGVKKDCLFCQWAHAILNEYVYAELGYQVLTSGTHGEAFSNWIAPQELLDNEKALAAFKEKLEKLDHTDDSGTWEMENGKVDKKPKGNYQKTKGNSHSPYELTGRQP